MHNIIYNYLQLFKIIQSFTERYYQRLQRNNERKSFSSQTIDSDIKPYKKIKTLTTDTDKDYIARNSSDH